VGAWDGFDFLNDLKGKTLSERFKRGRARAKREGGGRSPIVALMQIRQFRRSTDPKNTLAGIQTLMLLDARQSRK
jgi:hypothetical protein